MKVDRFELSFTILKIGVFTIKLYFQKKLNTFLFFTINITHAILFDYNVHISDKFGRRDIIPLEVPPWQTKVQVLVQLLGLCSIFSCISVLIFFGKFPNEKLFLSSLIFSQYLRVHQSLSWWIFLTGLALNTWIIMVPWACAIFCSTLFLIFVYSSIFLMQELQ